jgi:dipeptidyl aminopeptidase/acylaminoacyl peptidase
MNPTNAARVSLCFFFALAAVTAGLAQMQVVGKFEGEMLPAVDCSDKYLYVQKDGHKEKTGFADYTIRTASGFGDGFVEINNVKTDLDPLKSATGKERSSPDAVNFRFEADITPDRDLNPAFAVLTFVSEGSVGSWFIPIGHLRQSTPKHVTVAFHDRVDSVGRLHVFAQGAEVKSTQVRQAYDVRTYYASLVKEAGPSALELLKLNQVFPYVLSNNGRLLATLRDRDTYYAIVVYDLDARKALCEIKTDDHETTISGLTWVSDHEVAYVSAKGWALNSNRYTYTWSRLSRELMLLDVVAGKATKIEDNVDQIVRSLPKHPETLVLVESKPNQGVALIKFDIRSRKNWDLEDPEGGTFVFDDNGDARIHTRFDGDREEFQFRPTAGSAWKKLDSYVKTPGLRFNFGAKDMLDRVADILAIGPDCDTLYISTRLNRDVFQLDAFSMSEGVIKKTIATHPKYDLSTSDYGLTRLLFQKNSGELVGMIYDAERPEVIWLDPAFKAVQHALDTALPDHVNLPIDWSEDGSTFVYFSTSDRDPGTYYIFRPVQGILAPLLSLGERLKGRKLATTEAFDFTARDGATVHAYVTYPPAASGPVPLVVDIHGGPMVRDEWGFDAERQFLAARGYAVLQVNYRGSSGFGASYQFAGLKSRLDTVVIDDIADGTRHVIQQGRVDPKRVAVAGASFGGWATYMCLIRYPELYRAGVVTAGVAHWSNFLKKDRWNSSREFSYVFWRALLDKQDFKDDEPKIDPYLRAAEIKQPIYILQGTADPIVDAEEAQMMVKKLQSTNSQVEFLLFPNTGHTSDQWSFTDKVRRLNETAIFLDRQLKAGAQNPTGDAASQATASDGSRTRPAPSN